MINCWGLCFAILVVISPCLATHGENRRPSLVKITAGGNMKGSRTLLHALPIQAELQNLEGTLSALAKADGRRADLLLHKATTEAWQTAQLVANPLQDASPKSAAKRRLLEKVTFDRSQLAGLARNASVFLKNAVHDNENRAAVRHFLENLPKRNVTLPRFTPQQTARITNLINNPPKTISTEAFMHSPRVQELFKNHTEVVNRWLHRLSQPQQGTTGRRLTQVDNEANFDVIAAAFDALRNGSQSVPKLKLDIPFKDFNAGTTQLHRRALLESASQGNLNSLSQYLKSQVQQASDVWRKIEDQGGFLSGEELQQMLAARAAGLRARFQSLMSNIQQNSQTAQRRLLQDTNQNNADSSGALSEQSSPQDARLIHASTVMIVLTPADSAASVSFINDILDFLMATANASNPLVPSNMTDLLSTAMYGVPPSDYVSSSVDNAADVDQDASTTGYDDDYSTDSRRRRMLSTETLAEGEHNEYDDIHGANDNDNGNDSEWAWNDDDTDWMSTDASFEEAILSYVDEANETELLDLVVRLGVPSDDEGGFSEAMLEILADPESASVAELLQEIASGPYGGELTVSKSAETPPRFAVFGPSVITGFGNSAAVKTQQQRARIASDKAKDGYKNNKLVLDTVVTPLHGPKPHNDDVPSGMDARWLGIVLGLGGLGFLMVGAAVAAMRPSSRTSFEQMRKDDASVRPVGGKKGYEAVSTTPVSPWENKDKGPREAAKQKHSGQTKNSEERSSRKTSNLPA